ncbi:MAG: DUF2294 domain-containing protein [Richelia sp. RM2_1_2]|nr:DUF2294 domain-containing protein [Richelia sp. SM2_1_7]NJM17846.1 DUF2294 domain-containing protein [Richelia sp. SM1_7_0]NJN09510.1 DUF2294 domain-containing protein [Richelia sp. RM1_1_1]NJO27229.1 DUF2294 domain-containing protein [Richelia sp. SL_2_1]NJO59566.1 DUF2294 domain-containing protein [Richelia sp. RM2_1_2]
MKTSIPTRGQRERELSQRIQALYSNQLGHRPTKVTCQLFDNSLAIVMEDSITPAEQLLVDQGQEELAEQVRSGLDDAIEPKLKVLIEEILEVKVLDLMGDATLQTGRSGIVVVLSNTPEVRNPDAIPKAKSKTLSSRNGSNSINE